MAFNYFHLISFFHLSLSILRLLYVVSLCLLYPLTTSDRPHEGEGYQFQMNYLYKHMPIHTDIHVQTHIQIHTYMSPDTHSADNWNQSTPWRMKELICSPLHTAIKTWSPREGKTVTQYIHTTELLHYSDTSSVATLLTVLELVCDSDY